MQPSTMSLAILRLLLSYSVQNLIFVFICRDLLPLNIPCTKHNIKAAYLTFNLEIKAKQNSTSRWKYQNPLWNTLFLSFYLYTEAFDSLEHWLLLRSNCMYQHKYHDFEFPKSILLIQSELFLQTHGNPLFFRHSH